MFKAKRTEQPPDLESQYEGLLDEVWKHERQRDLERRIDAEVQADERRERRERRDKAY